MATLITKVVVLMHYCNMYLHITWLLLTAKHSAFKFPLLMSLQCAGISAGMAWGKKTTQTVIKAIKGNGNKLLGELQIIERGSNCWGCCRLWQQVSVPVVVLHENEVTWVLRHLPTLLFVHQLMNLAKKHKCIGHRHCLSELNKTMSLQQFILLCCSLQSNDTFYSL